MHRRLFAGLLLALALPLALAACAHNTELRFSNETACGTATLILTNLTTGNSQQHTVDQAHEVSIEVTPDSEYRYEVSYPRQPNFVSCESKRATVRLSRGQALNIRLESVLSPELEQATLEAAATTTPH